MFFLRFFCELLNLEVTFWDKTELGLEHSIVEHQALLLTLLEKFYI